MAPWHAGNAQTAGIPREKTLILVWWSGPRGGRWEDFELWNPYSTKSNPQNGSNTIYEPLAYYSASANKNYMWLAESYQFTPDFQQLTIRTRPEISWSDGVSFSAEDVAYTLNTIRDYGPRMKWGVDIAEAMKEARTTDANTVVVDFLKPSPRFFWFLTYRYDIGVFIVPKHIFDGQDWLSFKHFDLAKGWPVSTGPWKVVDASPEQKVFERRPQWWAVKAGLAPLPHIERNVWLPSNDEQALAQAIIANQVDTGLPIQPSTLQNIFRENPKVITYSGQKPPYGYLDWWPISLYLNNEVKPFDDPAVRWALSYYINRQQLIDLVWQGASQVSSLPM
jgi:peptide/nickel transport system substrate-binding protein